jgi:hypothetical protein
MQGGGEVFLVGWGCGCGRKKAATKTQRKREDAGGVERVKKERGHRDTETQRRKAREEIGWRNRFAFRPTLGGGVRVLKVFLLLFLQKKKALL